MTDYTKTETERLAPLRAALPGMLDHLDEFARGGSSHEAWVHACVTFATAHIHAIRDLAAPEADFLRVKEATDFANSMRAGWARDAAKEESMPLGDLAEELEHLDAWLKDMRGTQWARSSVWARKVLAACETLIDQVEADYYELDLQSRADSERLKSIGRALA